MTPSMSSSVSTSVKGLHHAVALDRNGMHRPNDFLLTS